LSTTTAERHFGPALSAVRNQLASASLSLRHAFSVLQDGQSTSKLISAVAKLAQRTCKG
jgi:hypothetical protein